MVKRTIRYFNIFTILIVLIFQTSLLSIPSRAVTAAPAQDDNSGSWSFAGVTISNVRIHSGNTSGGESDDDHTTAYVAPGSTFELSMDYSIIDKGCLTCTDQIEIGFSTASAPFACIYSGVPGATRKYGSATIPVTAPNTPGTYYLGFVTARKLLHLDGRMARLAQIELLQRSRL